MSTCVCGHDRTVHKSREGCIRFVCCDRVRNLFPGRRHTEHDGVNHKAEHCGCQQFQEHISRWQEDMEAGAIG